MRLRSCRGFSLTEILVATAVTTAVMALVAGIMASTNEYWLSGNVQMNVTEAAQRGLVEMLADLRRTDPEVVTITPAGDMLTYKLPEVDGYGDIQPDPTTGKARYPATEEHRFLVMNGPAGGQLLRQKLESNVVTGTRVLANHVRSISFAGAKRDGTAATSNPDQVTITLATRQDVAPAGGNRVQSTAASAHIQFRNEPYRPTFTSIVGPSISPSNTLGSANLDPQSLPNI